MRWCLVSMTLALLAAFLFDSAVPSPGEADPACRATQTSTARCDGAPGLDHAAPAGIEDELVKSTLTRQAVSLLDRGLTVEMPILIQELASDRCSLDLRTAEPGVYDPIELYSSAKRSVVVVSGLYKCNRCTRWHVTTASGFVVSATGAIVTNYHVVDAPDNKTLVVMTADRQVYPVRQVLAASRSDDLAILQIDATGLTPLPLVGSLAEVPVGSAVSVISHPDGRYFFYSAGVVSRHLRQQSAGRTTDALTITAEYARGSSGAPVLNHRGQVVAVVSSTESIYYTQDAAKQRDLQMVLRTCIPAASIWRLVRPPEEMTDAGPDGDVPDGPFRSRG